MHRRRGNAHSPGRTGLTDGEHGARLTALVPLKRGERTDGLVAVFSMLPHKPELTAGDVALLELLSTHGSRSLHYADLRTRGDGFHRPAPGRTRAR